MAPPPMPTPTPKPKAKPKANVRAIQCTNCGGSITLRGGHKVQSIACTYCNSVLDPKDDYAVLWKFATRKKPFLPIKLGAEGRFLNVDFVVIGVIHNQEKDEGKFYYSLEYLLFSPTHGYVWLCFEKGHWMYMREVKDLPDKELKIGEPRRTAFTARDRTFQVFESGQTQVDYVEGELTWKAKQGDQSRYLDAISPPFYYGIEERKTEREFFSGEFVPYEDVKKAFNALPADPEGVFLCQPYRPNPYLETAGQLALPFAGVAFMLSYLMSSQGKVVADLTIKAEDYKKGTTTPEFEVDRPSILAIDFDAPLQNHWVSLTLSVQQGDTEVAICPTGAGFFYGVEGGESWSEGTNRHSSFVWLPDAGKYRIEMIGEGGTDEQPAATFSIPIHLVMKQGIRTGDYSFWLGIVFVLILVPHFLHKYLFEQSRWAGTEESS